MGFATIGRGAVQVDHPARRDGTGKGTDWIGELLGRARVAVVAREMDLPCSCDGGYSGSRVRELVPRSGSSMCTTSGTPSISTSSTDGRDS